MDRRQQISIFTTASLPWMTGTAVNPLFRSAYLARDGRWKVTLLIPWLSKKEQLLVYPNNITFDSPLEQEAYVRKWLDERTGFISGFEICFYPGRFSTDKRSILPSGDITQLIPDEVADIAVLEEPEHLTWFHHGRRWKTKFRVVIGIVHTNYLEYVRREKNGRFNAFVLKHIHNYLTTIYCHKIIRLSAATQELPRSLICNVHGVNPKFLDAGKRIHEQQIQGVQPFTKSAYYIGKMIWHKGYQELLQLLSDNQRQLSGLQIDLYGNGEDADQIRQAATKINLTINVYPGRDHADPLFHEYKVFINPSTTDVVCTTTAEALAMGKLVVCADHPSNEFFKQFPNCLTYKDKTGFVSQVRLAMDSKPAEVRSKHRHQLSWEAATERFIQVAEIEQLFRTTSNTRSLNRSASLTLRMLEMKKSLENLYALIHFAVSGSESTRRMFGAIPGTLYPDDEQCRELGLPSPAVKRGFRR